MAAVGAKQKSVTVGRCIRYKSRTNQAGGPGPVFHDERLPKSCLQLVSKNTRVGVSRSSRGKWHDNTHRSVRIVFCSACVGEGWARDRKAEKRQNGEKHVLLRPQPDSNTERCAA